MEQKSDPPVTDERASDRSSDAVVTHKQGGGKIKRHCRRFWWLDLIILAIIILVIVLPVVYVGVPNKAQHDLNASTLELNSQDVASPQPTGIHLKLVTTAKSGSSFHPTIEPFNASLSLEGKDPFIYINVPKTKAEAETEIVIDQDVDFASLDNFVEYNKVVMGSEEFTVLLKGKTKLKLKGLHAISVNYDKKITMKGLNKLAGLNITDLKILFGENNYLSDGSNLIGNITIPNPSVMTLDLGNVTMDLSVGGTAIGYSLIPNLLLVPGDNKVPMQSTVDQATLLTMIKSNYTNAIIPLDIIGNSSISNGKHLTYYEAALKSNSISLNLDVGPALKAIGLSL